MSGQWAIKGREYGNCNCAYGCPCQFNALSTHGHCEGLIGGIVDEGHFSDVSLNGLTFVMYFQWPGEIAEGNGKQQVIIDASASDMQREAMRKILHGESTAPGSTIFTVLASTMSEVFETLYKPIDISIDVEARNGSIAVQGLVQSTGIPMKNPFTGEDARARIHLPDGFEYTYAEVGNGTSIVTADISLKLKDSYGQFAELHMNQNGVIR